MGLLVLLSLCSLLEVSDWAEPAVLFPEGSEVLFRRDSGGEVVAVHPTIQFVHRVRGSLWPTVEPKADQGNAEQDPSAGKTPRWWRQSERYRQCY